MCDTVMVVDLKNSIDGKEVRLLLPFSYHVAECYNSIGRRSVPEAETPEAETQARSDWANPKMLAWA